MRNSPIPADKPATSELKQYHIQCKPGDLAPYLITPGNPERINKIVKHWDSAQEISYHREFRSFTGKYKNVPISALSSGIGPACMAITVYEAANVGVETIIRVGSTGSISEDVKCGDLVISSAAVRLDGTSNNYVLPEYPAVANYEVLLALIEAAEGQGSHYHVGITSTTSDFYAGQARPINQNYTPPKKLSMMRALERANVLNFEMEAATLFTLSNILCLRAGAVCAVYANRITNDFVIGAGEEEAICVANEAIAILKDWDDVKKAKGKSNLFPTLLKY
jgi:uridine phosphorylase